ncbi:MAG: 4Fe-4S binding protein, partial [Spirochaetales bacterium]|nr:4Fe-4S binding protein [Spirochaetales bacterium]
MAKVTFNEDICKGCGLCVDACPKHILAIDRNKI